jgi:hypothetical protein
MYEPAFVSGFSKLNGMLTSVVDSVITTTFDSISQSFGGATDLVSVL